MMELSPSLIVPGFLSRFAAIRVLVAQTSVCVLFGSPKIKTPQAEACATKPCWPCHLSAGMELVQWPRQYFCGIAGELAAVPPSDCQFQETRANLQFLCAN